MTKSRIEAPLLADHCLDAGEASCADLLIRIVRTIRPLPAGSIIEVVAYSPSAHHDVPAWCRMTGNPLLRVQSKCPARFFIQKGER
jgi:tRNA 2-thiouridine synthesizing protein A